MKRIKVEAPLVQDLGINTSTAKHLRSFYVVRHLDSIASYLPTGLGVRKRFETDIYIHTVKHISRLILNLDAR